MRNIIIVGKSGSGKSVAIDVFKYEGYKEIVSHTTRPQRPDEPDTAYVFSSVEDFFKHRDAGEIFEYTMFGDNYYWTMRKDFQNEPWAIIVDPKGVWIIKRHFPNTKVILVTAPDDIRRERISAERYDRDGNRFTNFPCDYVIENRGTVEEFKSNIGFALLYCL